MEDLTGPELDAYFRGYGEALGVAALSMAREAEDRYWEGLAQGMLDGVRAGSADRRRREWIRERRARCLTGPASRAVTR